MDGVIVMESEWFMSITLTCTYFPKAYGLTYAQSAEFPVKTVF